MDRAGGASALYYASGGGHGHVLRGLAILARLGEGLLVGPSRLRRWAETLGVRQAHPPDAAGPGENGLAGVRSRWLRRLPRPTLLLADVFPRGVVGELADFIREVPAWLVTREVPVAFYLHPPVREALRSFELVIWTEPPPAELVDLGAPTLTIPPVLLDPERLSRDEARSELGVEGDTPLLLTIGTGDPGRQRRLLRLTHALGTRLGIETRFCSTDLAQVAGRRAGAPGGLITAVFPLARFLAGADVVVAAGGYHAVHEIRASGVPAVFIPQWRRYDDQAARVRGEKVARSPEELETRVRDALDVPRGPVRDAGLGAEIVARLLERRMQQGVLCEKEITAIARGVRMTRGEASPHAL